MKCLKYMLAVGMLMGGFALKAMDDQSADYAKQIANAEAQVEAALKSGAGCVVEVQCGPLRRPTVDSDVAARRAALLQRQAELAAQIQQLKKDAESK